MRITRHLIQSKIKIALPAAVSQRLAASLTGPLIRWETNYNGWMLLICEVQELLRQITLGAGKVYTDLDSFILKYHLCHFFFRWQNLRAREKKRL